MYVGIADKDFPLRIFVVVYAFSLSSKYSLGMWHPIVLPNCFSRNTHYGISHYFLDIGLKGSRLILRRYDQFLYFYYEDMSDVLFYF
jgi:hypothetical protein